MLDISTKNSFNSYKSTKRRQKGGNMCENKENLVKVEVENQERLRYLEESIKDLKYMIEKNEEIRDEYECFLLICRCFSNIDELEHFLIDEFNQAIEVLNSANERVSVLEVQLQQEQETAELEMKLAEAKKNHSEE